MNNKLMIFGLAVLVLAMFVVPTHATWWNSSWTYKQQFCVNSTVTTTLTNFPSRINIDTSNSTLWNTTTCTNVRFLNTAEDGTLSYELDDNSSIFCGNATNNATFWVKISSLPDSSSTYCGYAYLGNTNGGDGQNIADVWSNGYRGIYHFSNLSDSLAAAGLGNIPTANASIIQSDTSSGSSLNTTGKIYMPTSWIPPVTPFATTAWMSIGKLYDAEGGSIAGAYKQASIVGGNGLSAQPNNIVVMDWLGGIAITCPSLPYTNNTMTKWAGQRNSSTYSSVIKNGVINASTANTSSSTQNNTLNLFSTNRSTYDNYYSMFNGAITELRLHNATRNDDWLIAEQSQTWLIGATQTSNTAPTVTSVTATPALPVTTDTLIGNATCTDPDSGNTITAYWNWYKNGASNSSGSAVVTNNTATNLANISANTAKQGETWIFGVFCGDGTANSTQTNSSTLMIQNTIPTIASTTIIPTTPATIIPLNCSAIPADADNATLLVNFTWYKNTVANSTWDSQVSCTNNTVCYTGTKVPITAFAENDNFTCSAATYDGFDYSSWLNSSTKTIVVPLTIIYPANTTYDINISTLNYDLTSGVVLESCWYSTDNGASNSTAVTAGDNFTGVDSTAGSNTWTVYCNDSSNNSGGISKSFAINNFWWNTGYPFANNSFRITSFVNVSGVNFTLGGKPYHLQGVDSYYLSDYATNHTYDDDGNEINNSRIYVTEILDKAKYLNINVIRTWANMEGGSTGVWINNNSGGHHNLFEIGTAGNYSEDMFAALDWVISEASKRDIRLQLVLVNNWNDYGGMRWYVQQSPTTNKTFENLTDYSNDSYWLFHDQFYTDENAKTYYRNFINHTLNRNNTVTGVLYKNDPTIFAWLLANEPRAKSDGTGSKQYIINWTKNMTAYIKSIDTNHLVGLGIEGWGEQWEGTNFITNHNGTGVDFATFELHPDQWDWFAQRSENATNLSWVTGGITSNATIDWWSTGSGYSYNNRWEGGYVPNYNPALARHAYQNWVTQYVNWSNQLGMPVLLQELAMPTNGTNALKDRFYQQVINSFFSNGGDGLLYWNLNHDNYYFSTTPDGKMDDGYSFYLSENTTLKAKSASVISAFNFTEYNNTGGTSWVDYLNNYKYDFVFDIGIPNNVSIDNCSLNLNVYNGTWTGNYTDQTNTTAITINSEYTFTKQFAYTDQEVNWSVACYVNGTVYNSTSQNVLLVTSTPAISLLAPANASVLVNPVDFNYSVANTFQISYCNLYIDGVLNTTAASVERGIVQQNTKTFSVYGNHSWYVECKDIMDNVGTSETRYIINAPPVLNLVDILLKGTSLGGTLNLLLYLTASDVNDVADLHYGWFGAIISAFAGIDNIILDILDTLAQTDTAYVNDTSNATASQSLTWVLTNDSYEENVFAHTLANQQIQKNDTLDGTIDLPYNISHLTPSGGTLGSGGEFTGIIAATEELLSIWSGDWITGETISDTATDAQNLTYPHTLAIQGILNRTKLAVTNAMSFAFTSVDLASMCTNTATANVPSGASDVAANCTTVARTGDWITETEINWTLFQNVTPTSTLVTQYVLNQSYLNTTNAQPFQFIAVDISSKCKNLASANIPSGANQITTNCTEYASSGDWIVEVEGFEQRFQNVSVVSNLSYQYITNQTYLNATNSQAFAFNNTDLTSACENTVTANVSSGASQITTNCSYVADSGDYLTEIIGTEVQA